MDGFGAIGLPGGGGGRGWGGEGATWLTPWPVCSTHAVSRCCVAALKEEEEGLTSFAAADAENSAGKKFKNFVLLVLQLKDFISNKL